MLATLGSIASQGKAPFAGGVLYDTGVAYYGLYLPIGSTIDASGYFYASPNTSSGVSNTTYAVFDVEALNITGGKTLRIGYGFGPVGSYAELIYSDGTVSNVNIESSAGGNYFTDVVLNSSKVLKSVRLHTFVKWRDGQIDSINIYGRIDRLTVL